MDQAPRTYSVYMLECADGSFYIGMTTSLEHRMAEHCAVVDPNAYTFSRRPLRLVWSQSFSTRHEAFTVERQLKGWSRAKKEAFLRRDWEAIHDIVQSERKQREKRKRT